LHAQIAGALEAQSPELIETQPELLARHYEQAGLVAKSVAYWGKAGHSSAGRSAMVEAAAHFQRALATLDQRAICQSLVRGPEVATVRLLIWLFGYYFSMGLRNAEMLLRAGPG
jgi:predicted ATPase